MDITIRHALSRTRHDDAGAETLEFAVAGPVVLFLVFGLVYAIVTAAAYLSLTHAASVGVRYASIPPDPVHGGYRTDAEVVAKVDERTPFFTADDCAGAVVGGTASNDAISLELDCSFPNPFGRVLNRLGSIVSRSEPADGGPHAEGDLTMSVRAQARRE